MEILCPPGKSTRDYSESSITDKIQDMELQELREQACFHLQVLAPQIQDAAYLIDACIVDARKSLKDEFITMLSPEAWAKISLIYHKHFLDSGQDISIAEIIVAVVRDSVSTRRMDMVTLALAQQKSENDDNGKKSPGLKIVKE